MTWQHAVMWPNIVRPFQEERLLPDLGSSKTQRHQLIVLYDYQATEEVISNFEI